MKRLFAVLPLAVTLLSLCLNPIAVVAAGYSDDLMKQVQQLNNDAETGKEVPKELTGVSVITADEAFRLWKTKAAVFLDNRIKSQFDAERIEGAQWYPVDELLKNPEMAQRLDKSRKYVAYCNGIHCWRSPAAILLLRSVGFENVLWLRGGLPDWKTKGLPTE